MPSGDLLKATKETFLQQQSSKIAPQTCIIGYITVGVLQPHLGHSLHCVIQIKLRTGLQFNWYFSAWQIAMRPGEIEKAGKVSGTWQWLWLWWSILLLPLLTLPNIRDLHCLHPMLQACQLYKQRGIGAKTSISSTNRPACKIMPLQMSCWEVTSSSCSVLLLTWFGDFRTQWLGGQRDWKAKRFTGKLWNKTIGGKCWC